VTGQSQAPQISERMDPDTIAAGTPGFSLRVRGIGFVPGAVLKWNGNPRPTEFEDNAHVTATIPGSDIAQPGTALITIVNPGADGGTSNVVSFLVSGSPAH
jgi:hypothetical protein